MDDGSSIFMIAALIVLIMLSGFFSASETAYSSLNMIRLKSESHHQPEHEEHGATTVKTCLFRLFYFHFSFCPFVPQCHQPFCLADSSFFSKRQSLAKTCESFVNKTLKERLSRYLLSMSTHVDSIFIYKISTDILKKQ